MNCLLLILVGLSTERTTFSQTSTTTSGLTQDSTTRRTKDNSLSMAKDSAYVQTTYCRHQYDIITKIKMKILPGHLTSIK